ncbi:NAD(P)-binding domain-containing protein [Eikenella sp. S3360]|uniref:NAD(P)-binding domain-containing protein n=1 Tax=Eikenella glucosivorans TaxID=2766967 RepID=A0ABS0N9J8_9NEIS|nr:NAD(P)-binding domain-containing protein [Eikenella glucosivorans]MBH5328945.1 NAD(P)-binding domain-containing protein [Eikenella glucosivorans]
MKPINRRHFLNLAAAAAAVAAIPACGQAAPSGNRQNGGANPASRPSGSSSSGSAPQSGRPLKIGIIGAGWLGGTVGRIWVKAGHEVMFSARDLDKVRRDVQGLGSRAKVGTVKEAAAFGDVLLFAVPFGALQQLGKDLAGEINGKIVLDASNGNETEPLVRQLGNGNVGVAISKLLAGSHYARAFSCVDATQIEASYERGGRNPLAVPIASDHRDALDMAARLVRDAHCAPVSVGGLANSAKFQRGTPAFRNHTGEAEMRRILGV